MILGVFDITVTSHINVLNMNWLMVSIVRYSSSSPTAAIASIASLSVMSWKVIKVDRLSWANIAVTRTVCILYMEYSVVSFCTPDQ